MIEFRAADPQVSQYPHAMRFNVMLYLKILW